MAEAAKLKEFMVALGFEVDAIAYAKFNQSIVFATNQIIELGKTAYQVATTVVADVAKMANSFESLYYASQRTKATVSNIQAFTFAVSQIGGTAEGARGALESLARTLQLRPGTGSIFGLDPNGDATKNMITFLERIKNLSPALQVAYGEAHGLGADMTLQMVRNLDELKRFEANHKAMQGRAGVNFNATAEAGKKFMNQYRNFTESISLLGLRISQEFIKPLGDGLDDLGKTLERKGPEIARWLGDAVKAIMPLLKGMVTTIKDLAVSFSELSPNVKAAAAALGALMLLLWLSPLGRVIALVASLAALYDDWRKFKNGELSEFKDFWEKWDKWITAVLDGIDPLVKKFGELTGLTKGWEIALAAVAAYIIGPWIGTIMGALGLGRLLPALAMIPGMGITTAMLAGVGIAGYAINTPGGPLAALGNLVTSPDERERAGRAAQRSNARAFRRESNEGANDSATMPSRGYTPWDRQRMRGDVRERAGLPRVDPAGEAGGRAGVGAPAGPYTGGQNEPNAAQMAQPTAVIRSAGGATANVAAQYAERFQALVDKIEAAGYPIKVMSGHNPRRVRNGNTWSWHAGGGMALDLNPGDNPMDGSGRSRLPPNIAEIAASLGLGWGGNWTGTKDPMHFSVGPNEGGNPNWEWQQRQAILGNERPRGNMASPGAGPINQNNSFTVYGNVDKPVAAQILKELERPTQDVVRNQRGSVQ